MVYLVNNFENNLSAEGIILRYTSKPERAICFINLPLISEGERTYIVPAYFVDFFVFLCTELSTSFLISPSLASAKSIFFVFHDLLKV